MFGTMAEINMGGQSDHELEKQKAAAERAYRESQGTTIAEPTIIEWMKNLSNEIRHTREVFEQLRLKVEPVLTPQQVKRPMEGGACLPNPSPLAQLALAECESLRILRIEMEDVLRAIDL